LSFMTPVDSDRIEKVALFEQKSQKTLEPSRYGKRLAIEGHPHGEKTDGEKTDDFGSGQANRRSFQDTLVAGNSGLDVRVGLTSDLSELQGALPGIVQATYDHDDDCDYKLRVHTVGLSPYGSSARVFAAAHYEDWVCGPFGFKNRNFEQNGSASVKLTPYVNNNNVGLSIELLGVDSDGLLGGLLQNQIVGPWLMDSLRNVIPSSVSVVDIRSALPPELRKYRIDLTSLRFVDRGGGKLGPYCTARVQVSRQDAIQSLNLRGSGPE
jgi:hypothetical protein